MENNEKGFTIRELAKQKLEKVGEFTDGYANKAISNVDKIVKVVSFIVAISIFLVFLAIAVVLVLIDSFFTLIAVGVLLVGTILAMLSLFLIYGMGHIITQNNEILKHL